MAIPRKDSNLEFTKLTSSVSLYSPPASPPSKAPSQTDPTTIIICPWMGVSPRSRALNAVFHKYHSLYPSARLLTTRSLISDFTTTRTSTRLSLILPLISALNADPLGTENRRVLVHLFSNSGAMSFVDVCTLYRQETGKVLNVQAMVLDSSPGAPTFREAWAAMRIGLPSGIAWYPAAATIWFGLLFAWFVRSVLRRKTVVEVMREKLNDGSAVDLKARRLYVYGEKDELVGARDVERHAEAARRKSVWVDMLLEDETPHVQHMIGDRERYWERVEGLWDSLSE